MKVKLFELFYLSYFSLPVVSLHALHEEFEHVNIKMSSSVNSYLLMKAIRCDRNSLTTHLLTFLGNQIHSFSGTENQRVAIFALY